MVSVHRPKQSLSAGPIATAAAAVKVKRAYKTHLGTAFQGTFEAFLHSKHARDYAGKVQLIFTSPPFPLNRKKRYGNLRGDEYARWLARFAPAFRELLTPKGSIVIELGNAWEPGLPVMSTLALRALLRFLDEGGFYLCQQFVCHNPARLPTPAQWVNIKRTRVKDAFTHLWWMSPSPEPKASNRRVLKEYSAAMLKLLARGKYNAGKRPSQHHIGEKSFLTNNHGAIPSNVLTAANTKAKDPYQVYCKARGLEPHPARMSEGVPDFFIRFLTEAGDLILDPFAGSNTTGAVAERLKRPWVSVEPNLDYLMGSKVRFR
jgi:DNA modification methylase